MGKEFKVRILMRYTDSEGWKTFTNEGHILAEGEIGFEYLPDSALPIMKVGNGKLTWENLPPFQAMLPETFTWGDLRGTSLITSSSTTKTLELKKPGFSDAVNIVTLNNNFEKIDDFYKILNLKLETQIERISSLFEQIPALDKVAYPDIKAEIIDARQRFIQDTEGEQIKYKSVGDAIRALDEELQKFKLTMDEIVRDLNMPVDLEMDESTGKVFLLDKKGTKIGNGVIVKDKNLENQILILDSKTTQHSIKISDLENKINNLPSTFPNNLIYEDNILYLAVDDEKIEDSAVEITGGSGGSETSYKIELTTEERNISKPLGEQVVLSYSYKSFDKEDNTITDGSGNGELFVDGISRATFLVQQGENTFDVTELLSAGSNVIKIKVTNSEGSSKTIQFNILILSLSISTTFPKMSYHETGLLPISYTVTSEAAFTSHFVLTRQNGKSGESYNSPTEIFSETFDKGITSTAFLNALPSGAYTLEIFATSGEVKSNILTLGLVIYTQTDSEPFIVMIPNKTEYTKGEVISIESLILNPIEEFSTIIFEIFDEQNNKTYSETIENLANGPFELTSQVYPSGNIKIQIICKEEIRNSIQITIKESDIILEPFTDNLIFEFNPIGRTNQNSANQWSYGDEENKIEATFSGIDWGTLDGWQIKKDSNGNFIEDQTMLRILPGGEMIIPFYLFENEITTNNLGYTIEVEVATHNVTDYDALILSAFDETEGNERGLRIYSQSAELKSQNNSILAQFREDDRIRLTFTIEPNTLNRLIMIYINGVLCGIKQYESDVFRQENKCPIIIGAEDSGIDVYFIRAYKRVLDDSQQLNNFCVDRPSFTEKIAAKTRNDILNASAGGNLSKIVTINSLKGSIPYIIMHCPKLPANKDQDKFKGMKMTFVDPVNPSRSFTAEKCTFSVQGTSSAGYPVKNFKIKLDKTEGITYTRNGQKSEGFYFKGVEQSQPTKVFCLKADYASSENANNVMLVDYYNQTCPYRNEAQKYQVENGLPETVRHGIYGEPIVLFWENTNTGEVSFQGKYNFNDDKDSENVFGYVGVLPEDKYNIECWEFRNNNMDLCLFKHKISDGDSAWFATTTNNGETASAWELCFERRFPEQKDSTSKEELAGLRRMVDWVASTRRENANPSIKLAEEKKYRTLDTSPQEGTIYYTDKECTKVFDLTPIPSIKLYDADIEIVWDTFKNYFIPALDEALPNEENHLRNGYAFIKNSDDSWRFVYITYSEAQEEIENLIINKIENLNDWGVSGFTEDQQTIVFDYYNYVPWEEILYEKHTHDTKNYRLAKFKNEFEDYFILEAMAYYYVFTETVLLMDNRAKNMFLVSYDIDIKPVEVDGEIIYEKQPTGTYGHWAPTPYDMDSALGINNEGELVYSYHLEDTGVDGTVFTGQQSVLWNNFRDCFQPEIAEMYVRLRGQNGTTNGDMPFSYETLSKKMNNHQSIWPEVIWNIDQKIKYLEPFYKGIDHLAMSQGDKRAQRNFWLYNAFKYRDSKYSAGDSLDNFILFRLNGPGEFNIIPYSNIYARVRFGNAKDIKQRAFRNEVTTFSTEGIASIYDLETYIYSADRISSIGDLSDFHIGLCNFAHATKLKEIILGRDEKDYSNPYLKSFRVGASTALQEVNLSKCINLETEINLAQCPVLKTFKAKGSGITNVKFARGARLTTCHLPTSISTLTLLDLKYLTAEGLEVEKKENNKYAFTGLHIENCDDVPFYDLIMNADNLGYLRLIGLEWHTKLDNPGGEMDFRTLYNKMKTLKGLDANGNQLSEKYAQVSGKIYLEDKEIDVNLLEEINNYFPDLIIVINNKPQYFLTFLDFNNEVICKYVAAENSTPLDPTKVQIPGVNKTPEEILQHLNTKPAEDKVQFLPEDPEGEIDTKYEFMNWSGLPEKVTTRGTFTPRYKEFYLVKYYNEDKTKKLFKDAWIEQGKIAPDPIANDPSLTPTKERDAQFTYTFAGWISSLENSNIGPIQDILTGPINYSVAFSSEINNYQIKILAGQKQMGDIQIIPYGGSPQLPNQNVYNYYFNNKTGEYNYYEIFEHIGWDIYNDGDVEINFEDDETLGIIIQPEEYTEEIINIHAVFSSIEPITDNWETIIENCNNGNYKVLYPVGTQKEVKFTYRNQDYNGILEVVEHNKDTLASDETTKASLTFILKDIFTTTTFRNNQDFVWNDIKGPLAGGWTVHNTIYPSIQNIIFKDAIENDKAEVLNANIKEVLKKTDFGPARTNAGAREYYPTSNLAERIWTPSASEMGVLPSDNTEIEAQQGETYIWFTTNDSRKKEYNGKEERYWTRTWEGTPFRFYGIAKDGGYAYDISLTTPTIGILSFETAGLIFGLCI